MEEARFEVAPQLLEFALEMPVLPGREYIEVQYRREVGRMLRGGIDFSELRKQFEACEGESSMVRYTKICNRAKERLFLMWWLCDGEMLAGEKFKKEPPFLAKRQEEGMDMETLLQVFDLMIRYSARFIGKSEQMIHLKSKL
jgi:hypothetical protein